MDKREELIKIFSKDIREILKQDNEATRTWVKISYY